MDKKIFKFGHANASGFFRAARPLDNEILPRDTSRRVHEIDMGPLLIDKNWLVGVEYDEILVAVKDRSEQLSFEIDVLIIYSVEVYDSVSLLLKPVSIIPQLIGRKF